MGIIRPLDRDARKTYVQDRQEAEARQHRAAHAALNDLLPNIVEQVSNSAREWVRISGRAQCAIARLPLSINAITNSPEALETIRRELLKHEPNTATVEFDRSLDYSYDNNNPVKLTVKFVPPLT